MPPTYRMDNEHFRYHNENPTGKKRAEDCVVRALGYATKGWEETYKELCLIGLKLHDMPNSKTVVEKYLIENGWVKHKQLRKSDNTKCKVKEFCAIYKGLAILRIAHHLTVVDSGKIVDTWDCGESTVGNYWLRE